MACNSQHNMYITSSLKSCNHCQVVLRQGSKGVERKREGENGGRKEEREKIGVGREKEKTTGVGRKREGENRAPWDSYTVTVWIEIRDTDMESVWVCVWKGVGCNQTGLVGVMRNSNKESLRVEDRFPIKHKSTV